MNWLKSHYKSVIIYVIIYAVIMLFFTYPLPYYLNLPGGVESAELIVEIDGAYESSGSFNSSYVSVVTKPSPFQYLLAKFNDKADIYKMTKEESKIPIAELTKIDSLYKEGSVYKALIAAYKAANKKLEYRENGVVIIDRIMGTPAYEMLDVGDIIIEINDYDINNYHEAFDIIGDIGCKEPFNMTVLRNKKEVSLNIEKEPYKDGTCVLGLYQDYTFTNYVIDYEKSVPKITDIDFSGYGPSAGLIQTLSIYDMLVPTDITFGLKIAGTGTIDENGSVGPIGGIEQKIFGACKADVDIFFTPYIHYEDAKKAREIMKSDMLIVPVNTLSDAINYLLENYGE